MAGKVSSRSRPENEKEKKRPPTRKPPRGGERRGEGGEDRRPTPRPAPLLERRAAFPIVGIGASAGGLEALESFLRHVPERSGMAFVVVQHLDPTHRAALVELLQRVTPVKVVEVEEGQHVEPDCVYVIPPNRDMSLVDGALHLTPKSSPRGLSLPIDAFLRSLAAERQERSIGVVLSGMGSDGSLGLRAIKEKAGATFVQALASAKFEGMPRSAIDAGLADVVAPAEELPEKIVAYINHAPHMGHARGEAEARTHSALEKVFFLLRAQSGNDFSLYKRSTVERRIERRMGLHQIGKLTHYVRYVREHPPEAELLFKELLIGVTSFFRDPEAWESLRREVLPELLRGRARGRGAAGVVRAWVPACSTGEEAYSLAIALNEAMDEVGAGRNLGFQIFATDLDKEAIDRARLGVYPANIAADISPERLRRFFIQDPHGYRVRKEIRETVVFAPQNVLTDPPFTKLEILSCRNLLIYLSSELQRKLIPIFHYSLNPGGVLFLGSAETVGTFSGLFAPCDGKTRLYRRLETAVVPAVEFPSSLLRHYDDQRVDREYEAQERARAQASSLQTLADRVIVQRFAPASVLTSDKGDILYLGGRTGRYLEPPVGRANLNIFAMAREGLRGELSRTFAAALKSENPVVVRGVRVRTNGSTETIDLTVQRLLEPKELRGTVMVVMAATPDSKPVSTSRPVSQSRRVAELEREVQHAREEVQSTREEVQASQEELRSSNEELQSKVDDLARSSNDMRNLLNSTDVATLFLDTGLLVRRFTTPTTRIIKLIASDTGRPITDITTELDYPELPDDAREVLRTLVPREKQAPTRNGRWFTVRIMPYRTQENVIDGVVITFTDSTSAKVLETTLREQASQLRQLAESLPTLVWGCRPDGSCDYLSRQWEEYTGVSEDEQLGYRWLDQVHPDDRERVRSDWASAVRATRPLNTELRLRAKDRAYRWFKTRSVPIRDASGSVVKWYGTHTDVDDLKQAAAAHAVTADKLASLLEWIGEPALVLDDKLVIVYSNGAVEPAVGRAANELVERGFFDVFPEAIGAFEHELRRACADRRTAELVLSLGRRSRSFRVLVQPWAEGDSLLLLKLAPPS